MIRRPSDMYPPDMFDELRRLARMPVPPVIIDLNVNEESCFKCRRNVESPYFVACKSGQDYAGLLATVAWLRAGPKIVDVTEEQYQAMARVEVRLEVKDFAMPFPSLLVNMPSGKMHEYVLLHQCKIGNTPVLIGQSISYDHTHDIVGMVCHEDGKHLETTLGKYYGDVVAEEGEATTLSMRVACNIALAMTNYGFQSSYLFPKEVEQEKKFVLKGNRAGRDGRTASMRLQEQPQLLTLDRTVKLYHREGSREQGISTGRQMPFHWRRGHWHKVRCGVGRTETRLVLYPPTMIRADLAVGLPLDETTTTYR